MYSNFETIVCFIPPDDPIQSYILGVKRRTRRNKNVNV